MKIAIVGTGYVGLVSAACLASLGHEVAAYDKDPAKRARLAAGKLPIYEPGLEELVTRTASAGQLTFSASLAEAVHGANAIFVAVGTPVRNNDVDLQFVHDVVAAVAPLVETPCVIVCKSTVPVGTNRALINWLRSAYPDAPIEIASNPEFLREGAAIADFLQPDRIVAGAETAFSREIITAIYEPLLARGVPILMTDLETAELVKYAANAFLATKITFINEIADLCEKTGANVQDIARGIGLDRRIGPDFLRAGPGFGGSCFPKDATALVTAAGKADVRLRITEAVVAANTARKQAMADRIIAMFGGDVTDRKLAVLGVAFKAETDDMREAPSLTIIPALQRAGAAISAHDPHARDEAAKVLGDVGWSDDPYEAARDADATIILTDWDTYRSLDLGKLRDVMRGTLLVDLRNLLSPTAAAEAGFDYRGIGLGRPAETASSAEPDRIDARHAALAR